MGEYTNLGWDKFLHAGLDSGVDESNLAHGTHAVDGGDNGVLAAESIDESCVAILVLNDFGTLWLLRLRAGAGEDGDVEIRCPERLVDLRPNVTGGLMVH